VGQGYSNELIILNISTITIVTSYFMYYNERLVSLDYQFCTS